MSSTTTAWNRVVPLEGGSNFRDLGGYRTASGSIVRKGKLYRTAHMAGLTDADLVTIGALGLRTICDFRGPDETKLNPTRLPGNAPEVHMLSIMPKVGGSVRQIMEAGEARGDDVRNLITEAYRAYARDHVAQYRGFFERLTADDRYPIVFHCAAGKDRTGFAAALVLETLGVSRETILEDYALTNNYVKRNLLEKYPDLKSPELFHTMMAANPDYLLASYAAVDEAFGSFDGYLTEGLGMTVQAKEDLRALLLE